MWVVLIHDHRTDTDVSLYVNKHDALQAGADCAALLAADPQEVTRTKVGPHHYHYDVGSSEGDFVEVMERTVHE